MSPIPRSDQGAAAAQTQTAHVDPLTKSNISTRGKAMTWHNAVAGQGTFMSFDDDGSAPPMPQPMG